MENTNEQIEEQEEQSTVEPINNQRQISIQEKPHFTIQEKLDLYDDYKRFTIKRFFQILLNRSENAALLNIVREILDHIKECAKQVVISHLKGLWPFGKVKMGAVDKNGNPLTQEEVDKLNAGVESDHYAYTNSEYFKDDMQRFLSAIGVPASMLDKDTKLLNHDQIKEFHAKYDILKNSELFTEEELNQLEVDDVGHFIETRNDRQYTFDIINEQVHNELLDFMGQKEFAVNYGHEELELATFEVGGKKYFKIDPLHAAYETFIANDPSRSAKEKEENIDNNPTEKDTEQQPEKTGKIEGQEIFSYEKEINNGDQSWSDTVSIVKSAEKIYYQKTDGYNNTTTHQEISKEELLQLYENIKQEATKPRSDMHIIKDLDKEALKPAPPEFQRAKKPTFNIVPLSKNTEYESKLPSGSTHEAYVDRTRMLKDELNKKTFTMDQVSGRLTFLGRDFIKDNAGKAKIAYMGEKKIPCYIVRLENGSHMLVPKNKATNYGDKKLSMSFPDKDTYFYMACDKYGNYVKDQSGSNIRLTPEFLVSNDLISFTSYRVSIPPKNPRFEINGEEYAKGCQNGFEVYVNDKHVLIAGTDKNFAPSPIDENGHLSIPKEMGNRPVDTILPGAFNEARISSVDIPDSIKAIGDYAFRGSNITEIHFADIALGDGICRDCACLEKASVAGKELPDNMFANSALKDIDVSHIEVFGAGCLKDTSVSSLDMRSAVYLGAETVKDCKNLDLVNVKLDASKFAINQNTYNINAFDGCPASGDPQWYNLTEKQKQALEYNTNQALKTPEGKALTKEPEFQGADPKVVENPAPVKEQEKSKQKAKSQVHDNLDVR